MSRNGKPPAEAIENGLPPLPKGWCWASVGNIGDVITGSTPSKQVNEYFGGAIPFIKPTDLNAGYNVRDYSDSLTELGAKEARLLPIRTVLVTCIGATIGKTGLSRVSCATNQQINALVTAPDTSLPEWCYWAFNSSFGQDQIKSNASATTLPILNKGNFERIPLPVAPINEQRRIVAKIEELFSDLDPGVAALTRAKANLKRYRAAVLKAAVEGNLTADSHRKHPQTEPASKLLERILIERRKKWEADELAKFSAAGKDPPKSWKAKYPIPAPPAEGILPEIPSGWAASSLEQLTSAARPICYGILMPKEHIEDGVLYVKVKDMKGDRIDVSGLSRTRHEIAAQYARASLKVNDLLLAIRGTYGRVAVVPVELDGGNITQDTARLAISELADLHFVAIHLRSADSQNYFKRVARGVAVKGVNIGDVRPCPVLLPSLLEQQQIVTEVEERLSQITAAEQRIEASLLRAARLRQSILKQAFQGKLVPQDPNDESASVLLERLCSHQSTREAKGKAESVRRSNGRRSKSSSGAKREGGTR